MSCPNADKETYLDTTVDQWREAIAKLETQSDPGLTMWEISDRIGYGITATKQKIRKLIALGKCRQGYAIKKNSAGQFRRVPVYQLLPEVKSRKTSTFGYK